MQSKTEDDKRQASPTTACPAWCISHNADTPDKANDHLHEPTLTIVPSSAVAWALEISPTLMSPWATAARKLALTLAASSTPGGTRQGHPAGHRVTPQEAAA